MLVMTKLSKQLQRDNVLKIETDQENSLLEAAPTLQTSDLAIS